MVGQLKKFINHLQVNAGEKAFAIKALVKIMQYPASTQATKNRAETVYAELLEEGLDTTSVSFREDIFNSLVDETLGRYASLQALA